MPGTLGGVTDLFSRALDDLDFTAARSAMAEADEQARPALKELLETHMAAADREARALASEIQRLARGDDFEALLSLDAQLRTARLIALLPEELARGSEVQLDGARKWREQRIAATRRHLKRASEAIGVYDTARAKAEFQKVDQDLLTDEERAQLDVLYEQLTAAELERMELEVRTQDVLAEHQAVTRGRRRKHLLIWAGVVIAVLVVGFFLGR